MIEVALGALLLALVAIAALIRHPRMGAAALWAWAWALLVAGGLIDNLGGDVAWLAPLPAVLGSLAPALLASGARLYAGLPRRRSLVALGLGVGGARIAAQLLGAPTVSDLLAAVCDPLFVLAAAVWTWRAARAPAPTPTSATEWLLPFALLGVAGLELATALPAAPPTWLIGWGVVAPPTWILQMTALGERARAAARSSAERRAARLQANEARFRALTENLDELITEFDAEGRLLYASPRHAEVLGIEPDALAGSSGLALLPARHRAAARELIERAAAGEAVGPVDWKARWLAAPRWFQSSLRSFEGSDGTRHVVVSTREITRVRQMDRELRIARDELERRVAERTAELARANDALAAQVAERERAQLALRRSEDRYRRISELSSDYSYAARVDARGRVEVDWIAGALERITGYGADELARSYFAEIIHPEDARLLRERLENPVTGGDAEVEYRVRTKQGPVRRLLERVTVEREGEGLRVIAAGGDVTELRLAEEQDRRIEARLRDTQREQSLGLMAAGIAHDFNNLLMPILGHSALALEEVPADAPVAERIRRIQRASEVAADLVGQLLAYSGSAAPAGESIDLSALVGEMLDLLDTAVSRRGRIETDLAQGLPPLRGDSTQIRQVAMNLITNAAEALPERGGTIVVRTARVDADAGLLASAAVGAEIAPGPMLLLEVRDDGSGMDRETRLRIFDPFFTTRFSGRGLGLAAVLGIVRRHGGAIGVESEPGLGTTMRVLLPIAEGAPAAERPGRTPVARFERARALLVDDEEPVREIAREYLERAGFEVEAAEDGERALARLDDPAAAYDVVVLDLLMPGLDGTEVLARLRARHPGLPVVIASGHGRAQASPALEGLAAAAFLAKPYGPEELLAAVAEVLGAPEPGSGSRPRG